MLIESISPELIVISTGEGLVVTVISGGTRPVPETNTSYDWLPNSSSLSIVIVPTSSPILIAVKVILTFALVVGAIIIGSEKSAINEALSETILLTVKFLLPVFSIVIVLTSLKVWNIGLNRMLSGETFISGYPITSSLVVKISSGLTGSLLVISNSLI